MPRPARQGLMNMPTVLRCDLHIHTCLSPCADLDMYPRKLIDKCVAERLDVIAVTDHNASENVPFVIRAGRDRPLTVLPGMEITTREEVHMVAVFDRMDDLDSLQRVVYGHLRGTNREEIFGCQAIVNDQDEVEGFNERLLIGATTLSLPDAVAHVHRLGGIAVACHIDRESFSVISQLGFIGADTPFDALEVSHSLGIRGGRARFPELGAFAFITSSDAHTIRDIGGGVTEMAIESATVAELKMAFAGKNGRQVRA